MKSKYFKIDKVSMFYTRLWDISGDAHDPLDNGGIELAEVSLNEPY